MSGPQHSGSAQIFFFGKRIRLFSGNLWVPPYHSPPQLGLGPSTTALRSWVPFDSVPFESHWAFIFAGGNVFFEMGSMCICIVHTRTWRHQSTKAITTVFGFELPTGMYTGLALLNPKSKLRWCRRHVRVYSMRVRAIVCACVCDRRALCVRV